MLDICGKFSCKCVAFILKKASHDNVVPIKNDDENKIIMVKQLEQAKLPVEIIQ